MNRTADPDTAYRYAKGFPVVHPYHRARIRIETPLDFLVVSDHAELTSVPKRIFEGDGNGKLPKVCNTVDIDSAAYTNDIRAAQLATAWTGPDFDPARFTTRE